MLPNAIQRLYTTLAHRCDGLFSNFVPAPLISGLIITEHLFSTRFSGACFCSADKESRSGDGDSLWVFGITCGLEFCQLWHPQF